MVPWQELVESGRSALWKGISVTCPSFIPHPRQFSTRIRRSFVPAGMSDSDESGLPRAMELPIGRPMLHRSADRDLIRNLPVGATRRSHVSISVGQFPEREIGTKFWESGTGPAEGIGNQLPWEQVALYGRSAARMAFRIASERRCP